VPAHLIEFGTVDLGESCYEEFLQKKPPANGMPIGSSPRFNTSRPTTFGSIVSIVLGWAGIP
jgi:hypothetical protein